MLTEEQIEAIATRLLASYDVNFNTVIDLEDPRGIPVQVFIRCLDSRVCGMNFFLGDLINGEEVFELAFKYKLDQLRHYLVGEVVNAD